MIDRQALLNDLQTQVELLEADLLERSSSPEVPDVGETLRGEFAKAKAADRTAQSYQVWLSDAVTQHAVAWVLSCVFVRFLEDNQLIDPPRISGQGPRLQRARDEHEIYFRANPKLTDRDYLLWIFDELAKLPGTKEVFGEHNLVHDLSNWLSGDAAGELLRFFQKIDANTGTLIHDFTDAEWDTRFLGDLYQDLSEAARKKYALLQTPEFVEEFILDRTLEPALDEFGLDGEGGSGQRSAVGVADGCSLKADSFRMIDPACGSGHFLLGSFRRILARWQKKEPGAKIRELVQRTLDSIHGVDLNPYAVAIARFRLLLASMRECGIERLADAPAFRLYLVCGDSLLHGSPGGDQLSLGWHDVDHVYRAEDLPSLRRILKPGGYHAVVANPPYITPKDRALNVEYRRRYSACHMKYSLAVPFMQRIFDLAVIGGYTGQITANSFMKREFGKKLIEVYLPTVGLTHVIDTSGAYIPGHGTPTVILFGRHRKPVGNTLRTVMGIRGEPATPSDPAKGLVWSAIAQQIDHVGSQSEFVSVGDSPRALFEKHPWSIGGGGAAELKEQLEQSAGQILDDIAASVGFMAITGEDDVFVIPVCVATRNRLPSRLFSVGDMVRDWRIEAENVVVFPYNGAVAAYPALDPDNSPNLVRFLWPFRATVRSRSMFGKTVEQHGFRWYEYMQFIRERIGAARLIAYAEVATHNHFVLERGGKVFKQTAPVIKLCPDATEEDHLALLGLLNSSTACFWLKQVSTCKGLGGQGGGIKPEDWHRAYAFNGTKLLSFPIPIDMQQFGDLARQCDSLAHQLNYVAPEAILITSQANLKMRLTDARIESNRLYRQLIAKQEELDWMVYGAFGIAEYTPASADALESGIHPEDRPVERLLREKISAGEPSIFYDVHASRGAERIWTITPPMTAVIDSRVRSIARNADIRLIETPNYKRRWQVASWEKRLEKACEKWLLDRLDSYFDFDGRMNDERKPTAKLDIQLVSTHQLADIARQDEQFQQVGELYRDDSAFDVARLVAELVAKESVPLLPILRYKDSGLRKRKGWEDTWELQRREDALSDQLSAISNQLVEVCGEEERKRLTAEHARLTADRCSLTATLTPPPEYKIADFLAGPFWSLRGKLDVPKERWNSFPHCEGEDGGLMIAWAGYDHLQLARAVSGYYVDIQEQTGGRDDPRLVPLLACLLEVLPWVKQWHNDIDPEFQTRMGDYFEGFVQEEAKQMGKTLEEVKAWVPPKKLVKGVRRDRRQRGTT